ncbi:MAG: endonuclease III [Candidatus Lernaella stagnicola]|nr:endonuclease III [Candidatus Lernaella stagnicola]
MNKDLKKKSQTIYRELKKLHHDAHIELVFADPVELLIATILSAQCTDVRVNAVTANLFKKYRKPADYLAVPVEELEKDIRPTGFFRNKTKSIRGAMQVMIQDHGGKLPQTLDDLVKLPGVGRKTANVVLGNVFDTPGVVVDTHVSRIARRLGLTTNKDPVKIEFDLMELFPRRDWTMLSHVLIFHGRRICKARKPACDQCPVTNSCDYFTTGA